MIRHEKNEPFLQFDFCTNGEMKRSCFTNPIRTITTNSFNEVHRCLKQIDDAVRKGYYVAGYISYEATYALQNIGNKNETSTEPLLWFGIFSHKTNVKKSYEQTYAVTEWEMLESDKRYFAAVDSILKAIENKTVEQINYTVRFRSQFTGSPYAFYETLKRNQQANYNAYLHIGHLHILSVSPELFFHYDRDKIILKPMKGTISRGLSYEEDEQQKRALYHSKKDRHENDLITSLMLKEVEQLTERDRIHKKHRYNIETYPTVHQMTTTIEAQVEETVPFSTLINTFFPCGSIAGTPKKRVLEQIEKLEQLPRHIYCGAIGFITPENEATFNVAIRTVTIDEKRNIATYGAGGAITAHSNSHEEYSETLTKTNVLKHHLPKFQLLETMLLTNGTYFLYDEHIERLRNSATYFQFNFHPEEIKRKLNDLKSKHSKGKYRVRLTMCEQGKCEIVCKPLTQLKNRRVRLASEPIDSSNPFLYHKTTERSIYEKHAPKQNEPYMDVLLWNERGEITEFTIGNVVVEMDGKLITPPVSSGLLAGTYRNRLLAQNKIIEKTIYVKDLARCTSIWFINSVRKWLKVELD